MKHLWLLPIFCTTVILPAADVLAQDAPVKSSEVIPSLPIMAESGAWEMSSKAGRRYKIFAAWPKAPSPPDGYPVVYVLDANVMFGTMADTVRVIGKRPGFPAAIVIGIGYPDNLNPDKERALDLTPKSERAQQAIPGTGGAQAFLDFIASELKPEVSRRFKIDPAREALFGHSFGGLFTLYALANRPNLADTFIAASPSLWLENELGPNGPVAGNSCTSRILITVGQFEQAADPDFPPPSLKMLVSRQQISNAKAYSKRLKKSGCDTKLEILAGEDHASVPPVAIARANRFLFGGTNPGRAKD